MWNNYLVLVILVPVIVAIVNIFVPKVLKKILTLAGILASLYFSIRIFIIGGLSFSFLNETILKNDALSNFILLFINILSLIILIYSLKNVKSEFESKFFLLFPLTVGFCNGVAVSANIIAFLIFWGLSGLVVYLFGLLKGKVAAESSRKAFIIIGSSDVLLLLGLILMQSYAKTNNM
ncbi:MAG: hypothetical protein H8D22_06950, partial [Candidatus Cloacimonetes bacterium]|nr:hypothetical protein [Candidatus Cloacimonadota bacterium]